VDPDQVYWIRVLERVELLLQKESGAASFGAKVAPSLKRVDLTFTKPVTGSVCRAKCSNILQDKSYLLFQQTPLAFHNVNDTLKCSMFIVLLELIFQGDD
jgi:hypothetical protein